MLHLDQVTKRYPSGSGELTVLDRIELKITTGEAVAVVGPSGSGKSTLLGLVAGLDVPTSGRVLVDSHDLATFTDSALATFRNRRMGFLFQSYRLLPGLTAHDNVRLPLDLAGRADAASEADRWLEKVGLFPRRDHRPNQLSGGEQQRVALARALVNSPSLLFADEPTGNLDRTTGTTITELIFELVRRDRITCLYVTHDPALAQRADRIIQLADGRIVAP